jgi:hypothetical protein
MKREEDEQLWDLLGHAKEAQASPFFARDVLRKVRQESSWKIAARSWFSLRRLAPAAAAVVALVAAIMLTHQPAVHEEPASPDADLIAKIDPQDFEVVADLDDLMASEDNNLWDDSSSL